MSRTEQQLIDACAVLDALRPTPNSSDPGTPFGAAWAIARSRAEKAAEAYTADPDAK
jgi:hypothetical protein